MSKPQQLSQQPAVCTYLSWLTTESIEVRLECPMIICLNKSDLVRGENCQTWIRDYESFTNALTQQDTYLSSLSKTVVLHMSDFYEKFMVASISARTGDGLQQLDSLVEQAVSIYKKYMLEAITENHRNRATKKSRDRKN